jgi:hypothetical protein
MHSGLPDRLQHRLVWLYFPLGPEEEVQAVWVCCTERLMPSYKVSAFIYAFKAILR